jgi:integrase
MKAPNGYGGISKLSGRRRKPFVVRLTIGHNEKGYPVYKILGYFKNRFEANLALADYHKQPYNLDLQAITTDRVFGEAMKENKRLTDSSKRIYLSAYGKYMKQIAEDKYKLVNLSVMQNVVDGCDKPSTRKQIKKVFAMMDSYALEHDIINKGYAQFIKIAESDSFVQKQKTTFTYGEIEKLWQNSKNGDVIASIILLYLYSGFRRDELKNMLKESIHNDCFVGGSKTKAGKNRIVPIHSAIKHLVSILSDDEYILPPVARTSKFFYYEFQNYCEKELGARHIPHECRHTFITELNRMRADPICIDRIVGHSSGHIGQDVYTHKTIEELRQNIELIRYASSE